MSDIKPKKPRPHILRNGDVFAKVWRNKSKNGYEYFTTTFGKIYTDRATGEVRETQSFQNADLLKIEQLADEAARDISIFKAMDADIRNQTHSQGEIDKHQKPSGLEAQRDQAMAHATTTPNKSNGADNIPRQNTPEQ